MNLCLILSFSFSLMCDGEILSSVWVTHTTGAEISCWSSQQCAQKHTHTHTDEFGFIHILLSCHPF